MESENTNSFDNKLIGDIPLPSKMRELVDKHVELSERLEIEMSRLAVVEAFERWERNRSPYPRVWLKDMPHKVVQRELKQMGYNISNKHSDFVISW